jgi:hypothetical protein
MKQVRRSVFETNSSSTHSITICTEDEYEKFKRGELMYDSWGEKLVPKSSILTEGEDGQYCTYENLGDNRWYSLDVYSHRFTTPSGDKMVAFGTYGRDG